MLVDRFPAFADQAIDDLVDPSDRPPVGARRGEREALPDPEPAHRVEEVVHHGLQRGPHDFGLAGKLGVEQGPGHDRQRQARKLGMQLELRAVAPAIKHPSGLLDHLRGIALNLLVLERRLRQPPLPLPVGTLAGQEPLTDQGADRLCQLVLDEVLLMGPQDVFEVLGMDHHIGCEVAEPQLDNIAVVADRLPEKAERVFHISERIAQQEAAPGTGWQLGAQASGLQCGGHGT